MLDDEDDLAAMKVPEEDDRLSQLLHDYWPLRVGANGIQSVVMKLTYLRQAQKQFKKRYKMFSSSAPHPNSRYHKHAGRSGGACRSNHQPLFGTNRDVRIGLIALFTSLFGFSLCLLTNAREGEIFGASAAVLVVFVSGDLASRVATLSSLPLVSRAGELKMAEPLF
jgi:hypothetical protein